MLFYAQLLQHPVIIKMFCNAIYSDNENESINFGNDDLCTQIIWAEVLKGKVKKDTIAQNTMQLVTVEKCQPVDTILNMNKAKETQTDDTSNAHYSSH